MVSAWRILLSFLLLSSISEASAVQVEERRGRFVENEHSLLFFLVWVESSAELRLVSRVFKAAYDKSRFFRLSPTFRVWIRDEDEKQKALIRPFPDLKPEIGLDYIVSRVAAESPVQLKPAIIRYLSSLPLTKEGDALYFKAFQLLKIVFRFEHRIAGAFEFDLRRLARIIAARPFNEAECFQLFIGEDAPVTTSVDPGSGRNVLQEALLRGNSLLAKWILQYFGEVALVRHADLERRNGLHYSSAFGDFDLAAAIYALNAESVASLDSKHQMPIDKAVKQDHIQVAKFLRSKRSPINGNAYRENSIFSAIANKSLKSLEMILQDANFNAEQLNRQRQTIWQAALLSESLEVVKIIFRSRHSRFSAEQIRKLAEWSKQHATGDAADFIEDYYDDFLHDQRINECYN